MKAVQFKFGRGDHAVVNIPKPTPGPDELLVKVKYSALDACHSAILNKELTGYFVHSLKGPAIYLGYHYSGTVEEVGPTTAVGNDNHVNNNNNNKEGEEEEVTKGTDVFGFLQYEPSQTQGAFAEYIIVKRQDCAIKPPGVSHLIAAASTTESVTALQALRDLGGVADGPLSSESKNKGGGRRRRDHHPLRILIVGAAGGVGSAAVQIAKQLGNTNTTATAAAVHHHHHVTAVCRTQDVAQVKKEWGADVVIDRSRDPNYVQTLLQQQEQRFDVILDVPNVLPACATNLLTPNGGGVLVNTIPTLTFLWNKIKTCLSSKKTVSFVECHSSEADLKLVGTWLEKGGLDIPIDSTFKVKDIEAAMTKHADKKKNGRVVIQVENGWN